MLTADETTLINNIAAAVGKSAEFVIAQYTTWVLANAIGWMCFGILICWSATRVTFDDDTDWTKPAQFLAKGVVVFIGAMFILACVPDIANPTAAAIHQLLQDVR